MPFMNPTTNSKDISTLLAVGSTEAVLNEVLEILRMISSDFDTAPVRNVYEAAERLYSGNFSGYRACTTGYHDFRHAVESFLAMSRLIHGAVLDNPSIENHDSRCCRFCSRKNYRCKGVPRPRKHF